MVMGGGRGQWGGGATPIGDTGLPFAGIPPEYLERIDKLMQDEREVPIPEIEFTHRTARARGFTLRGFLRPHARALLLAFGLVSGETLFGQVGPRLTGYGIDHGVIEGDLRVLLLVGAAYLVSILGHGALNFARVSWTGRLGQRLMYGLRLRVFEHLQRLSLDFYTREKAGRIMTRMTSDIEALQGLFSEGLVQLSLQGLTLVAMIGFMLSMNVRLTLILLLGVAPVMLVLTLWFRGASDSAYDAVRERIHTGRRTWWLSDINAGSFLIRFLVGAVSGVQVRSWKDAIGASDRMNDGRSKVERCVMFVASAGVVTRTQATTASPAANVALFMSFTSFRVGG